MPQPRSFLGKCPHALAWIQALAAGAALGIGFWTSNVWGQPSSIPVLTDAQLPEPIYWKQNLFLIPYQWSSAADPGAAHAVWLLVSKDHGLTWQKISEAKPQVKAFNYHAEGDGEYWFAIRTLDRHGQLQPQGPYQPELRVIVDTTMPRIESLSAQLHSDGSLAIQWRGSDLNLDPSSLKFEVQLDATGAWHPMPLVGLAITPAMTSTAGTAGVSEVQTAWQPPPGTQPRALRAAVYDRAGNSAAFGAAVASSTATTAPSDGSPSSPTSPSAPQGWVSASDAPALPPQSAVQAAAQPWPAGAVASAPFRLSAGATPAPGDRVTSYGNPPVVSTPIAHESFASRVVPDPAASAGRGFAPLEPYRESVEPFRRASLTRLPPVDGAPTMLRTTDGGQVAEPPTESTPGPPAGVEPKRVGSRTFALEYELEEFGRWGIARVELWGTRDGGQTWRSYAVDDDHRSPVVVSVEDAGLYGFRIVVESDGGGAADPPRGGDAPELWVDVDLNQPVAELTSVQLGSGDLAGHVILHWRAADDNLEPRPIALFYSSRPAGPWSAIATNLQNTGEYVWQVQRHVPERFYLRLEARDTAGNLSAFQTRDPVAIASPPPTGRLLAPAPVATRGW